jgi:hypothetical protein
MRGRLNRPFAAHELQAHATIKVYFDSGVHSARRGFGPRTTLGYAIFSGDAERGSQPLQAALAGSGPGGAIGFWHLDGKAILERVGEAISSYPASRGAQLYDLVAAHAALLQVKANEYRGRVRMLGDGKEVIEFLSGRDEALHLEVEGQDLALTIRRHIRSTSSQLGKVTWEWVPRESNWVDPILTRMDADLGPR